MARYPALCVLLGAVSCLLSATALASSREEVRFDVHPSPNGYSLVARGRAGLGDPALRAAFDAKAKSLCADGTPEEPFQRSDYEYLEGGMNFLTPVAGIFLPTSTDNGVKPAPLLAGKWNCAHPEPAAPASDHSLIRITIVNNLGEAVPYLDEGSLSTIRGRKDVPLVGSTLIDTITRATTAALAARGYEVQIAQPDDPKAYRLAFTRGRVSGENFEGLGMLTKLSMFGSWAGISVAFCSFQVAVAEPGSASQRTYGAVRTRQMIPLIYSDWDEIDKGPSEAIHTKTSAAMLQMVERDVRAAIFALPPETLTVMLASER